MAKQRPVGQNTKPAVIAADLRQLEALRLRLAKWSLLDIAEKLGYASESGAKAAIAAGMMKVGVLPTQEAVAAELADLHAMHESLWTRASDGDIDAIKAVLEVMKRRHALQGLDAPTKVAHTDPTGQYAAPLIMLPPVEGTGPAAPPAQESDK